MAQINSIIIKASTVTITPATDGNFNVDISPSIETPAWALAILNKLGVIITKEDQIMSAQTDALDQAEAAAKANAAADDSAEALLVSLSKMISDLVAAGTDPATVDRINALATALNERAAQLGAAVAANTPAPPAPAPAP